jgi:hypothetical protein
MFCPYLKLYAWDKPRLQEIQCCSYPVATIRGA